MFCQKCNNVDFIEVSVCESCGTISNKNISENFPIKLTPIKTKKAPNTNNRKRGTTSMQKPSTQINLKPSPKPILTKAKPQEPKEKTAPTTEIHSKATSPTLVEFQHNDPQMPEWRLQLKNAVQKKYGKTSDNLESGKLEKVSSVQTVTATAVTSMPTNGKNALKAEVIEEKQLNQLDNEYLTKALNRIERSRKKYYTPEPEKPVRVPQKDEKPAKDYPFKIASRNENPTPVKNKDTNKPVISKKPKLVAKPKTNSNNSLYDTSELDPEFIPAKISSSFEKTKTVQKTQTAKKDTNVETAPKPTDAKENIVKTELAVEKKVTEDVTVETNEIDDLAPFSLRINAGIFDIIISSFASLILLAPFVLLGGNWFSVAGIFAFLATNMIVMFIYMTTVIGLFGKTFGMHLFSLEMIDYETDDYPTFHQSAVSSSIFLLSIALVGLGFVTVFFDEDKRAVHDLVSKTLVVKEI